MTLDPTLAAADEGKTVDADLVPDQQYVQASDHLHPSTNDSVSDNDTSERPVREKLKKTSIASMPRTDVTSKPNDSKIQSVPGTKPDEPQQRGIPNDETPSPTSEPRGRLSRKRSFDDTIEVTGREYTDAHHDEEDATHARKRSRDVRATLPHATESPAASPERTSLERDLDSDKSDNDEVVDEGIENSAQSPRKKRSREEFEVDPQREQKIAATDEAKAYRRSEDSERGQLPPTDEKANFTVDSTVPEEQQPASEEPSAPQQVQSPRAEPSFEPSEPPSQKAPETANAEQKASQKAPTSFAASGFAAMANSSKSPFGTFGASNPSIFRSSSPLKNDLSGTASKSSDEPQKTHTAASTGFSNSPSPFLISATASTVASGFGFGANGAPPKPGAFSGSVFGSAFANKASAAPKLTSFAAPTGDLAPPKPAENARIFGTQAEESGEEDGGSDNEADPDGVASGDVEVDSRFQQREGRHPTICLSDGPQLTATSRDWRGRRGSHLHLFPSSAILLRQRWLARKGERSIQAQRFRSRQGEESTIHHEGTPDLPGPAEPTRVQENAGRR